MVRLRGVLTAAEQQPVKSLPGEKGRDLLKQVRIQLLETARPVFEAMVQEVAGVKVLSLHHDISTLTGEEVMTFTPGDSLLLRARKKQSLSRQNLRIVSASGPSREAMTSRNLRRCLAGVAKVTLSEER